MGDYTSEPSIDISTKLMEQRIDAIHCRLLERATKGRLTWRGDEIVRVHPVRPACPRKFSLGEADPPVDPQSTLVSESILANKHDASVGQMQGSFTSPVLTECLAQSTDRPDASATQAIFATSQCDDDSAGCPAAPRECPHDERGIAKPWDKATLPIAS